jgi:hypothetical protein
MKIIQGEQYASNVQGTSTEINIDVKAMSDDETITLLDRHLSYGVNTDNLGWREQAVVALKEQLAQFEIDANKILAIQNKILNISVDVAKAGV